MFLSILVPIYNEKGFIAELYRQVMAGKGHRYEIASANDGSQNGTAERLGAPASRRRTIPSRG